MLAAFGGLDLVVSNAGANAPNRSWSTIDAATVTMMLESNLKVPFLVARAVLLALRASRGLIVHVAS